jgi:carboxyl-terminal processing protease
LDEREPRLGIVKINLIASSTPDEVRRGIEDLQTHGASAFLLDLRDNYGGLLTAGVDVARLFLKDGVVMEQQYRGREVERFEVDKPGPFADLPLAILINENTASAAEIIAGALQARGRARLIGTHSFGKDTIQLVFNLQDGSSLHVTSAHWWIPGLVGELAGAGLQPDIPIPPETAGEPGLQAAISELFGVK